MIRAFESSDMNDVLNIWLEASIGAHGFVGKEFWELRVDDMRETYIPDSDTYVFSENGTVKGFFSLQTDTLAAMFVSPGDQGKGIGQQLQRLSITMLVSLQDVNKNGKKSWDRSGCQGTIKYLGCFS